MPGVTIASAAFIIVLLSVVPAPELAGFAPNDITLISYPVNSGYGIINDAGSVVDSEGTPEPFVTRTLLLAAGIWLTVFAADEYKILFAVVVTGQVAIDQLGAALAPESNI